MGVSTPNQTRRTVLLILTNLISLGCLVWVLNDAHLSELGNDLASMHWGWVGAAVAGDLAVYFVHGWRWSLLLRALVPARFGQTVRAIYIGLFANEVLPFKVGELIRCYLISRWTGLPMSVSITSALIERIFDGLWLVICMFVALAMVRLPRQLGWIEDGGYVLGMLVLAAAVLLAFAMYRRHETKSVFSEKSWQRHLRVLVDDLHMLGHSKYLYLSALVSVAYLLLQVFPIYAMMRGYGLDLSVSPAFVLLVILRIGSVLPQAPGNLGVFQLLTQVTLEQIFAIASPEAKRFSLVLWGVVTLPLLIGGFIALVVSGLRIRQLRKEAQAEAALGTDAR